MINAIEQDTLVIWDILAPGLLISELESDGPYTEYADTWITQIPSPSPSPDQRSHTI